MTPAVVLEQLRLTDLRGYGSLDIELPPGPQLVWGPNAAGKTSLLEAIVLLAWGASHRTSTEGELVRWGAEFARVEGVVRRPVVGAGPAPSIGLDLAVAPGEARPARDVSRTTTDTIELVLARTATGGARKRVRVNGVARRAAALVGALRTVLFAPEEMLLVIGSPSVRRESLDRLAGQRSAGYLRDLATYGRALQQRNGLLRLIREEQAGRDELRFWDATFLEAGSAVVAERLRVLDALAEPLARAHAEIAPEEAGTGRLGLRYATNAPRQPAESPRDALARRLAETAEKEVWNGTTLVGPHRDDMTFVLDDRPLASFASRGQQRTAILALKLAELDLLTALDGRPPLLLLDDVFSELDPERRAHLVRRIAELPQAFVTTTTLDDLDPALRSIGTPWQVATSPSSFARLVRGA